MASVRLVKGTLYPVRRFRAQSKAGVKYPSRRPAIVIAINRDTIDISSLFAKFRYRYVRFPSAFSQEIFFIFCGMNELPKQRPTITSRGRVIAKYRTAHTAVDGRPTASRTGRVLSTTFGGVLHSSLVILDGAKLPTAVRQD